MKKAYVSVTYLMYYEQEDDETEEDFEERVERDVNDAVDAAHEVYGYANDVEIDYM